MAHYCSSRLYTRRRFTREVLIGGVGIGGENPIRVQSMTTSNTRDVAATVRESIALAEAGCEIIRITAPNVAAAQALGEIRKEFRKAGFTQPLVADIHFLPAAAMEAVKHVEKVRINPGNYADKKKFAIQEYSDAQYEEELERIHETFSPLVLRCKELGRAMRIGTNHGSLSDRIMNRYGDTPLGMVESALEFLRIAESHGYHDIVLSMKASNPKVMIQAYRLLVDRMAAENMHYPLHLGVTEAGDGEDGRIKSAIGIGSLLLDGLGDTIRVSLTEDSVYEIPVARALADKAMALWKSPAQPGEPQSQLEEAIDPYQFQRREITRVGFTATCQAATDQPPVAITAFPGAENHPAEALQKALTQAVPVLRDNPLEGILLSARTPALAHSLLPHLEAVLRHGAFPMVEFPPGILPLDLPTFPKGTIVVVSFPDNQPRPAREWFQWADQAGHGLAIGVSPVPDPDLLAQLASPGTPVRLLFPCSKEKLTGPFHAVGQYRQLIASLAGANCRIPLWIRSTPTTLIEAKESFLDQVLEASILAGSLLCDGLGDAVSLETVQDPVRSTRLLYNVLQGAGARISKTEFVACPSCGRTLFDLQTTTQRIRSKTGHLKGVKIAIMGCIVNGPGEMADADFGYVGGAPGKINLYVGKTCVEYNIPTAQADQRLIDLIRSHGKWTDPETVAAS